MVDLYDMYRSAFFHTKPANHDKKLVHQGFRRVLFIPYHGKYWRQKPMFYEISSALYFFHLSAIGMYLFCPNVSPLASFEAFFPILLLLLVSIGYGRVSSALQAGGDIADPTTVKLFSPTKSTSNNNCNTASSNNLDTTSTSTSTSTTKGTSISTSRSRSSSSNNNGGRGRGRGLSSPTNVSSSNEGELNSQSNGSLNAIPSGLLPVVESDNSDSTDSEEDSLNI
jgi:hypothetical protein